MDIRNFKGTAEKILPRPVFFQVEWILKDYDRLKEIVTNASVANMAEGAVVFYADNNSGLLSRSVIEEAMFKVDVIERSLNIVPEEYREAIFDNLVRKTGFPDTAADNTWKKWKHVYIIELAKNLNLY